MDFKREKINLTKELIFQALEWKDYNLESNDTDSDTDSKMETGVKKKFTLCIYGSTIEGHSVTVTVKNIPVYFYIKVPKYYQTSELITMKKFIFNKLFKDYKNNFKGAKFVIKKDFYGFKGKDTFKFIKLTFDNSDAMKQACNIFNEKIQIKNLTNNKTKFKCYESNVDPVIRFIHLRNLKTCGWISIEDYEVNDISKTQIDIITNYKNVNPVSETESDNLGSAPFMQASFDIEVYSQYITLGHVSHDSKTNIIKGTDTIFMEKFKKDFTITMDNETRVVTKVTSNTELEISEPFTKGFKDKIAEINKDGIIPTSSGLSKSRMFPSSKIPGNYVTQIGTTFKRFGQENVCLKHIITLKKCAEIKSDPECQTIVESYNTESELLLAWKRIIVDMDPDILYTYNGDGFDCDYLVSRAKMLKIDAEFTQLGRIEGEESIIKKETFSSGAYGTRHYKRLKIPGRINFDVLIYILREKKLVSYKLDDVAKKFLKETKHSVSPADIFNFFQEGSPEKIRTIAEYCIQDTMLPQRLMDKMDILPIQIEMANVTYVPFRYLIERGQQIKVFSQIIKETSKRGYLIPHMKQRWWKFYIYYKIDDVICYKPKLEEDQEEFEDSNFIALKDNNGQPPLFKKDDSFVLNSKYWDIFKPEKFKGATVLDPKKGAYWIGVTGLDFASLYPSIMIADKMCYSTFVLPEEMDKYGEIEGVDYVDIKWNESETVSFHFRFAQTEDAVLPFLLQELLANRRRVKKMMQEEVNPFKKSILNGRQLALKISCNSFYGFLAAQTIPCKDIGRCVTTVGRRMIDETKYYLENDYPQDAIKYGLTDKLIKTNVVYGDSVTGDNIIVLKNENETIITTINDFIKKETEWKSYSDFSQKEYMDFTKKNVQIWSKNGWVDINKLIRHECKKTIYSVNTNYGFVKVTEDHSLISKELTQIKPQDIENYSDLYYTCPKLEGTKLTIQSYLQVSSLKAVYYIINSFITSGYKNHIQLIHSKNGKYDIIYHEKPIKQSINITSTVVNETFVYDFETKDGTFHCGIGDFLLKNTDSCMVIFDTGSTGEQQIKDSFEHGKLAGKLATDKLFKKPNDLEFEKVYKPYLLFGKKRYIGNMFEKNPEKADCVDCKGIELKRRDNAPIVKKIYQGAVDIVIDKGEPGVQEAVDFVKNELKGLIDGNYNLEELVISKSLKDSYKTRKKTEVQKNTLSNYISQVEEPDYEKEIASIPHVYLVEKIRKRDPGNAPVSGDRVPFVFIEDPIYPTNMKKASKVYTRSEDPDYAQQNKLKIDIIYYLEQQIRKPLSAFFNLLVDNPDEIFEDALQDYIKKRSGQKSITSFFIKK